MLWTMQDGHWNAKFAIRVYTGVEGMHQCIEVSPIS